MCYFLFPSFKSRQWGEAAALRTFWSSQAHLGVYTQALNLNVNEIEVLVNQNAEKKDWARSSKDVCVDNYFEKLKFGTFYGLLLLLISSTDARFWPNNSSSYLAAVQHEFHFTLDMFGSCTHVRRRFCCMAVLYGSREAKRRRRGRTGLKETEQRSKITRSMKATKILCISMIVICHLWTV